MGVDELSRLLEITIVKFVRSYDIAEAKEQQKG